MWQLPIQGFIPVDSFLVWKLWVQKRETNPCSKGDGCVGVACLWICQFVHFPLGTFWDPELETVWDLPVWGSELIRLETLGPEMGD